jgi:chromate reductase, NAD(P)H dehydrogenase (quinone)
VKILGIAGSLRKGSYNRALLNAAAELAQENFIIEIFDIANIPMFNEDLESEAPEIVVDFKKKIITADALLFSTPEYNYSIPGVLKNAIDWASRPASGSPLNRKPIAIMGGSGGMGGTIRSQLHLRQVALFTNMMDMKKPEILVTKIQDKFDKDLTLIDDALKMHLKKFLYSFEQWISIFNK